MFQLMFTLIKIQQKDFFDIGKFILSICRNRIRW